MPHKDPWVSSVYWAVTTMCTIRYGDISAGDPKPQTPSPEPGDGEQRAGIQTEEDRERSRTKNAHTRKRPTCSDDARGTVTSTITERVQEVSAPRTHPKV